MFLFVTQAFWVFIVQIGYFCVQLEFISHH